MKIAIVGGGISGMVAAYLLSKEHDITLFENNGYIGGHTNTCTVSIMDKTYMVDTGFIVFNDRTYPNFCKLLDSLGVESQLTGMTFSVKEMGSGFEYNAHSLGTLFARKRNLLSWSFYRMLFEILRFRREFPRIMAEEDRGRELVSYLNERGYSQRFGKHFIVPLAASLWSTDPVKTEGFPLRTFAEFCSNHGIFETRHPIQWRVIRGGSVKYVEKLTASYRDRIRLNSKVEKILRTGNDVRLFLHGGGKESFEHVVLAVHSNQALAMLEHPTEAEREILGAFPYQKNQTVLHTDISLLPERKKLWASWNYCIPEVPKGKVAVTYDMNILQSISAPVEFCVTLNQSEIIDKGSILREFNYEHPLFLVGAPAAQKRHWDISGKNRTHYCGAYWGYGFHEDGVRSALHACKYFNCKL